MAMREGRAAICFRRMLLGTQLAWVQLLGGRAANNAPHPEAVGSDVGHLLHGGVTHLHHQQTDV
jgi:hypothetical protein